MNRRKFFIMSFMGGISYLLPKASAELIVEKPKDYLEFEPNKAFVEFKIMNKEGKKKHYALGAKYIYDREEKDTEKLLKSLARSFKRTIDKMVTHGDWKF